MRVGLDGAQGMPERLVVPVALADHLRVERVVVDAEDLATEVLPAVVGDHRAAAVDRAGEPLHTLDVGPLPWVAGELVDAQLSLKQTQATMQGWLWSRRSTSSHSLVNASTAAGVKV